MQTQHTPGPWKIYDEDSATLHVGTISANLKSGWNYETVCHLFEDIADNYDTQNEFVLFPRSAANARLIAAAPDLLSTLLWLLEDLSLHAPKLGPLRSIAAAQALRESLA